MQNASVNIYLCVAFSCITYLYFEFQLTDLTVQYLSGVCHYLRQLDISGSLHIT